MKRSPELASLSRDHHQALVVAQTLRRATADSSVAAREACLEFWHLHGRKHFGLEEEVLLPAFAAYGDPYDPLVARVLCDHVAIRQQIGALTSAEPPSLDDLHQLGEHLAGHVRREERELFPLIERFMPREALAAVAAALEEAE